MHSMTQPGAGTTHVAASYNPDLKLATRRLSPQRGMTSVDWLTSYHTFSFGAYKDPEFNGFGTLRVINDDTVKPGGGFATHGHQQMEIITLVIRGTLAHKDSLGNGSIIHVGDVQVMSAGQGIQHSEFNASQQELVHFLQVWVIPNDHGMLARPRYDQRRAINPAITNRWQLLVTGDPKLEACTIYQDVRFYYAAITPGMQLPLEVGANRCVWIHGISGRCEVNGERLEDGDGLGFVSHMMPGKLSVGVDERQSYPASLLVFDVPPLQRI
ncbi:MAG: pirin family protein [Cyanobacteria bacterium HKST-UBA04]|nr:pirin family protein [Cyanobacteria bacterium HKST-UBA04]MCA9840767.1 pirin family protein [Cyanobacteria bacterium HKST-UBA03]